MRAPLRNGARSPTPWDPGFEKLAGLMGEAEHDVLAFMTFPKDHRDQDPSTRPIPWSGSTRRSNGAPTWSASFQNEEAITRLVGAILLEPNDEWTVYRRYMTLETLAGSAILKTGRSQSRPSEPATPTGKDRPQANAPTPRPGTRPRWEAHHKDD